MTLSRDLAKFVTATDFEALPPEAVEQAKRALLDTLGVTLAGCREDGPAIVAEQVRETSGAEEASVIGRPFRAPVVEAALVNGTSAHALDFDDVNFSMRGHPSAPLLPAALAVGEETGASGADLVAAFVLGMEVEAKLGRLLGGRHYALGWHATSTLGTLGAAAASAKLLRLNIDRTRMTLGIAASMASGVRANFGTMTKPLHVGLAARNGVQAATLAAAGFTAADEALDGEDGFVAVFLAERPDEVRLDGLGSPYDIVSPGLGQKLYPCCYATHRAVDAAIELAADVDAGQLASIHIGVSRGTLMPLLDRRPVTGLEGKFGLAYCVSAGLLDGAVRMTSFTDDAVRRPEISRLLDITDVVEDGEPQSNPLTGWAELRLELSGGGSRSLRVDVPRGDPRRPLTWEELADKFRDCASVCLSAAEAEGIVRVMERLDELKDVRQLTSVLAVKEAQIR
jgi:2-methylcitrate dehydratase PrpD